MKRIVIAGRPQILRELLARAIDSELDLAVVEPSSADVDAIVISALGKAPARTVLELLSTDLPRVVLVLEHDAKRWSMWTLRPHRTELGEPSLSRIVDILRAEGSVPPLDPN